MCGESGEWRRQSEVGWEGEVQEATWVMRASWEVQRKGRERRKIST